MDAKNSPLALLAQTCSSIGKETPVARKSTPQNKIYSHKELKKTSSDSLLKPTGSNQVTVPSPSSPSSDHKRLSPFRPLKRETSPLNDSSSPAKKLRTSPDVKSRESAKPHASLSPLEHRKVSDGKRRSAVSLDESETKNPKADYTSTRHKSLSGASPNTSRTLGGPGVCPPASSAPIESSRTASQETSPQQQLLSLFDPYCMGCHGTHLSGNPCLESMKLPHFPLYPFTNPTSAYPYYAQMLMAARNANAAATVEPVPQHVCNWVNSETGSCGKRFATAEELFNHLRTHAVATSSNSNSNYLLNGLDKMAVNPYAAYLSQQAAALAAVSPSSNNPMSANFLTRSHSPLSRFQSYKPSNMFSQLSGLPSLPIAAAGIGPYCSPYSLYGQRIGAGASAFSYP